MKYARYLLIIIGLSFVCMSLPAQNSEGIKEGALKKWMNSQVWSEGLKAKPHASTNLAEFKAQYDANPKQWEAAFKWLASHDLTTIASGRHPIEGTSLVVSVEDSFNDPLEKRRSESHRKHIDLQYVVKGTERFGLLDHASSKANCEYNEKKDVIHYDYDASKTKFIDSVPGRFFLFFPSDWHIAKIATDKKDQSIRVIVIKLDYMQ